MDGDLSSTLSGLVGSITGDGSVAWEDTDPNMACMAFVTGPAQGLLQVCMPLMCSLIVCHLMQGLG
jgi:hypothetical protein